jgi:hypothetical protein
VVCGVVGPVRPAGADDGSGVGSPGVTVGRPVVFVVVVVVGPAGAEDGSVLGSPGVSVGRPSPVAGVGLELPLGLAGSLTVTVEGCVG